MSWTVNTLNSPYQGPPRKDSDIKHALKNALIPLLTFGGLTLAGLLNGSVAVEVVFAWLGIGRLMLDGISRRDFPIVQATCWPRDSFTLSLPWW
jgi:ABC-type dipeptide/oligopeptide/nickel transport system permease component